MARAHLVNSAQKDIYQQGRKVETSGKKGYRIDRSQPYDSNDKLLIKKGEPYWWWKFNFSPIKYISKDPPKPSQLTQSDFLQQLYGIQEDIANDELFTYESFEDTVNEIKDRIQSLLDETQEKLENMPEHLQESSSSGETLTERIQALEEWISEIDSLDCDMEIEEIDELDSDGMTEEEKEEQIQERQREKLEEKLQEFRDIECSL